MKFHLSGMIFLWLLSPWSETLLVSSSECPAKPSKGMDFSISSRKNLTGHWNALVHLRHGRNKQQGGGAYDIDIKQVSEECGDWENVDITVSVTAPPPRVGAGYELVPGLGYYKLHTAVRTWPDARQTCADEGGHLAVLNSEKEVQALMGIFSVHPNIVDGWQNSYAHVGFHDLYEEGKFITIFGDSLQEAGYSKFAPGQPNQGRGANCGCVERTGGLHDVGCMDTLAFFCEQELLSR